MTPKALYAAARRLCLLAGIILAVTTCFLARPELYRLARVDFTEDQSNERGWSDHKDDPLDEYIAYKTENRVVSVSGQAWQDVLQKLSTKEFTFVNPIDAPFADVDNQFDNQFTYVKLDHNGQEAYIELTVSRPGDYPNPPSALRYPWRQYSLIMLLAGLVAYFVIPWPRWDAQTAAYGKLRIAWIPDLLIGSLFVGLFYALPWLIVPSMAGTSHPFVTDGGWIILSGIFCAFALFGIAIYIVDLTYETKSLTLKNDQVQIGSFAGIKSIALHDIQEIACGQVQPPKALVKAGLLMGLISWRVLGPTLLVAGRHDSTIDVILKNGKKHSLVLTCLKNWEPVLKAMKQAGISVSDDFEV